MPYTPVELRHVKIGRALFGYKRTEAERLLEDVADSFEDVWRDRGELADKVEDLEKQLGEYKQREHLLTRQRLRAVHDSQGIPSERAVGENVHDVVVEAPLAPVRGCPAVRLRTVGRHGVQRRRGLATVPSGA